MVTFLLFLTVWNFYLGLISMCFNLQLIKPNNNLAENDKYHHLFRAACYFSWVEKFLRSGVVLTTNSGNIIETDLEL